MDKPRASCPKCGLFVDLPLLDYLGPHTPQAHVRCPHCATWLLLSLRARLLGAATMFAVVAGPALALNLLGAPHWPPFATWAAVVGFTLAGLYAGARVIRSQARWQLSDYGG